VTVRAMVDFSTGEPKVIVRHIVQDEAGGYKKFALARDGSWAYVPEGAKFPRRCYLPVTSVHMRGMRTFVDGAYL